jgi:hypothetical protein
MMDFLSEIRFVFPEDRPRNCLYCIRRLKIFKSPIGLNVYILVRLTKPITSLTGTKYLGKEFYFDDPPGSEGACPPAIHDVH